MKNIEEDSFHHWYNNQREYKKCITFFLENCWNAWSFSKHAGNIGPLYLLINPAKGAYFYLIPVQNVTSKLLAILKCTHYILLYPTSKSFRKHFTFRRFDAQNDITLCIICHLCIKPSKCRYCFRENQRNCQFCWVGGERWLWELQRRRSTCCL